MISNRFIASLFLLLLIKMISACSQEQPTSQGFAGLGAEAEGFAQVMPNPTITYPDALNMHPDYRIEWWYVTANLESDSGKRFGVQWTLFRQANSPAPQREGWANQQLWLGHVGITHADQHLFAERYARGGIGQAGIMMPQFHAWIDDWSLKALDEEAQFLAVSAADEGFHYQLSLSKTGPYILQGDQGFSVKSDQGQASYYMSLPFLDAEGSITLGDETFSVTGQAWIDREWSSQPLAEDQQGWDWFSLHLDNGDKLMLFRLRHAHENHYFSGTYISANGNAYPLRPEQIQMRPLTEHKVAGRQVPVEWHLTLDDHQLDVTTRPLNPNSWMATGIAYWEGPITFSGTHSGRGYLEMTGY